MFMCICTYHLPCTTRQQLQITEDTHNCISLELLRAFFRHSGGCLALAAAAHARPVATNTPQVPHCTSPQRVMHVSWVREDKIAAFIGHK